MLLQPLLPSIPFASANLLTTIRPSAALLHHLIHITQTFGPNLSRLFSCASSSSTSIARHFTFYSPTTVRSHPYKRPCFLNPIRIALYLFFTPPLTPTFLTPNQPTTNSTNNHLQQRTLIPKRSQQQSPSISPLCLLISNNFAYYSFNDLAKPINLLPKSSSINHCKPSAFFDPSTHFLFHDTHKHKTTNTKC